MDEERLKLSTCTQEDIKNFRSKALSGFPADDIKGIGPESATKLCAPTLPV